MTHLSLPLRLPDENAEQFCRLESLTRRVANRVLERYWTAEHLAAISEWSHRIRTYFDETTAFNGIAEHLLSRYRRCVLQKIGETLRSHAERRDAFTVIRELLPPHKIRRVHTRQIKETLWDTNNYLSSAYIDSFIEQLNGFYDIHGRWPADYFELQDRPVYTTGVLPYSADDGPTAGQILNYEYNTATEAFIVKIRTPDSDCPTSWRDWSWTEYELDGYGAFHELLQQGDVAAPTFHPATTKTGDTYYELQFPVELEAATAPEEIETILAVDAGLRKDATCLVLSADGEQLSTPHFIYATERESIHRLHHERTRLNDKLAQLRRTGRAHTSQFGRIQAAYERVNSKIHHKRQQLVHDVANQLLALALLYDVDAIVHEDLRSLSPPTGEGTLSWKLSTWSRRKIIEKLEYRADLAGFHLERVFPGNTSRTCPRCTSVGHTTKSPTHQHEERWGGHFRCDNTRCGFQGDRDYVGAVNVGRVFFSDTAASDFSTSYMGVAESVLACRSAGTRPTLYGTVKTYRVAGRDAVTAGGGSAYIAPAVTALRTENTGSDASGPATRQQSTRNQPRETV